MKRVNLVLAILCFSFCLIDIYKGMYGFAVIQFMLAGLNYMCYKQKIK